MVTADRVGETLCSGAAAYGAGAAAGMIVGEMGTADRGAAAAVPVAAAWCSPGSTASAIASPPTATTPPAATAPDRKLISSMRA